MNRLLLIILSIVLFASCKKEPLPELPAENEPYYNISGLVNGDSINWTVGKEDATLSHGVTSMNGIQSFYGQINSPKDGMAIRIEILRPEIIFDGAEFSIIHDEELPYLVHEAGAIKFNFGMNYQQFNYLLIKNELNDYVVMNQVPFKQYGLYTVDLKFTDFGPESFSVPVKYGFEDHDLLPAFTSSGDGNVLTVKPLTTEGAHEWYIDGVLVSEEAAFSQPLEDGIYTVQHKITDDFHNCADYTTLIRFMDGQYYWQLKYYYVPPVQPSSHYGSVIVSMQKNGVWYSSTTSKSNLDYKFHVSNVETILDGNFEPLWTLFDFSFGTALYHENQTDSLYLSEMAGTVNVALK